MTGPSDDTGVHSRQLPPPSPSHHNDDDDECAVERVLLRHCEEWMRCGCRHALIQAPPTLDSEPGPSTRHLDRGPAAACVRVLDRGRAALAPSLFGDFVPGGDVVYGDDVDAGPGRRPGRVRPAAALPVDMFLLGSVPAWAREPRRRVVHVVGPRARRPGSQIVYYCHETLRLAENVALWMALWLGQHLRLPVAVVMVAPGDGARRSLRAWMRPPHVARRLHALRALRDALRPWRIPALLFRAADPVAVLDAYAATRAPHVLVTDEFVWRSARLRFDARARTWPFAVFAFSSGLTAPGLFALDAPAEFDVGAVRQRFFADIDRVRFEMPPSRVPEAEVQAPLFVDGTWRVFIPPDLVRQVGVPDAAPPGTVAPSSDVELLELGQLSPFRRPDLVDDHVRRQRAIWLAVRSTSAPSLPGDAGAEPGVAWQQVAKAATNCAEFNSLQERLQKRRFLEPGERHRWARLLWQLVGHPIALTWAVTLLETYAASIRRPIVEFELYLDMTSDP